MNADIERQRELTAELDAAARAYYDEDREIMPNVEYDRLYGELVLLESKTGIVLAGSPTGRVGYTVSSELKKQNHTVPMLSLNKTKSIEEIEDWLESQGAMLSYKMDGLT